MSAERPKNNLEPKSLPPITSVEILLLDGIQPKAFYDVLQAAQEAPRTRISGQQAQEIASLWRELPQAMQARCHVPKFGLRFYSTEEWLLEAAVCWECNNVYGRTPSGNFHFEFDATSTPAAALLDLVRQLAPTEPPRRKPKWKLW